MTSAGHVLAGRYEILSEIGRGGFGMVYRARQLNVGREVAIKVLPPQFMGVADVVERFKREAQLASRLCHPNTITIHDYGRADDLLFIVMELLRGEDLADVLRDEGRLDPERIVKIARQVLASLREAHAEGIVHRDLKPENIFLTAHGPDDDFVKVLDFGIAKMAELKSSAHDGRRLTATGSTVGTPAYMSPEQAAGEEVDQQTDIYALGVIMYEMACGHPPFDDENPVKVMRDHLFTPVPPLPSSSPLAGSRIERVLLRALHKERPLRYESADEFLRALETPARRIVPMPPALIASAPRPQSAAQGGQAAVALRRAPQGGERADAIPFSDGARPAGRRRAAGPASTSSSILRVIAPPADDEVFVLTQTKARRQTPPAPAGGRRELGAAPDRSVRGGAERSHMPRALFFLIVIAAAAALAAALYFGQII